MVNRDTYMYYAEQNYEVFNVLYNAGKTLDVMAATAQEACEKYLKHIIDIYCQPSNVDEDNEKTKELHSHNLRGLVNLLEKYGVEFPNDVRGQLMSANGFYFSTRYPGEDAIYVTKKDIEECKKTLDSCRNFVIDLEKSFEAMEQKDDLVDAEER